MRYVIYALARAGFVSAMVMAAIVSSCAYAQTFQEEQATITAEVNNSVEATEDGCVIEYPEGAQIVDCETLEPAGGSEEE